MDPSRAFLLQSFSVVNEAFSLELLSLTSLGHLHISHHFHLQSSWCQIPQVFGLFSPKPFLSSVSLLYPVFSYRNLTVIEDQDYFESVKQNLTNLIRKVYKPEEILLLVFWLEFSFSHYLNSRSNLWAPLQGK